MSTVSAEDIESLREAYAAFNRGDPGAVLKYLDPAIEWHSVSELPDRRVLHGLAEVEAHLRGLLELWETLELAPQEITVHGDKVLVVFHQSARGASGVPVTNQSTHLWTVRDGKAIRLQAYRSKEQALEAIWGTS